MKLLLDMNLSPRWVAALSNAGFDVLHWSSVGTPTASDIEITAFARLNDYVPLTHDLDFGAILAATGGQRPSVVQIRADNLRPEVLAGPVVLALRQMTTELAAGALITVNPGRTRLRLLPLPSRD